MTNYVQALVYLVPSPKLGYAKNNPDYNEIEWMDERPKPTREECEAIWPQANYEAEYARVERARQQRYQSETDPMYFKAQRDGDTLDAWVAAVNAIKAELTYPAPIS